MQSRAMPWQKDALSPTEYTCCDSPCSCGNTTSWRWRQQLMGLACHPQNSTSCRGQWSGKVAAGPFLTVPLATWFVPPVAGELWRTTHPHNTTGGCGSARLGVRQGSHFYWFGMAFSLDGK